MLYWESDATEHPAPRPLPRKIIRRAADSIYNEKMQLIISVIVPVSNLFLGFGLFY